MEQKIKEYLNNLEKEKDIEILLACETGSRAWGFPSPDSDYDVRLIYKHKKNWYLSLMEEKDTIECFYENNDIDISGWDLRKSLRLLWKSNPPLLEWLQSPIIYKVDNDFARGIISIAEQSYSKIATIHHYLSMAKKIFEEISDQQEYKLKKFFYALRASVACMWILEKEKMPPIEFKKMLAGLNLEKQLTKRIDELIEIKAIISEAYLHSGEVMLLEFMKNCIESAEMQSHQLAASKAKMSEFNSFFIKTLG